jgi:peroxiredoxin
MLVTMLTAQAQNDPYKAEMEGFLAQERTIYNEYRSLYQQQSQQPTAEGQARMEQLEAQLEALERKQVELTLRIAREQHDTQWAVPYIKNAAYSLSFEQLTAVLDSTAAYYNSPELASVKRIYEGMKKRQPGMMFHDLEMQDMAGNTVRLSQWAGKGHYVMVDFWASWCGPCRQEMPNVVANYEKYHQKGFEVVGVSFDQKKDAWVNAVQQMGMRWPQMSDLKGWKCAASEAYGIFSIPGSVLLDPQGKIVTANLRGKALGQKLKEIYGE